MWWRTRNPHAQTKINRIIDVEYYADTVCLGRGSQCNSLSERFNRFLQLGVFLDKRLNFPHRMEHRCVIFASEGPTHFGQGRVSELAGKIHGDLPGESDRFCAVARLKV